MRIELSNKDIKRQEEIKKELPEGHRETEQGREFWVFDNPVFMGV